MARRFDGSGHYLQWTGSFPISYPFTISGYVKTDPTSAKQVLQIGSSVRLRCDYGALYYIDPNFSWSASLPANKLTHVGAIGYGPTQSALFINGKKNLSTSGGSSSVAAGDIQLGGWFYGDFAGDLAEIAVHKVALSDVEMGALAAGSRADQIRKKDLTGWWRLLGGLGPERDLVSGRVVVPTNGSNPIRPAPHPPIQEPKQRRISGLVALTTPRSLSAVMEAAIQASSAAATGVDAALQAAQATASVLDAGIARAVALAAALDAQVQIPTARAAQLDAAIQAARNAAPALDAAIRAGRTLTPALEAAIAAPRVATVALDGAVRAAQAAGAGLDAAVAIALGTAIGLDASILASLLGVGLDAYVAVPGAGVLPADLWLAEIVAAIDESGTLAVHRFSSGPGYNHPTAPGYYEPRILQPANLRRDLFAAGTAGGRSQVGAGELVLANSDGALDSLLSQGLDGRDLQIKLVAHEGAYASALTVLRGTMEQAEGSLADLRLRIRDRQQELEIPLSLARYGGTNESGQGVDGGPELKDRPKPKAFGEVFNIEPVAVNPSLLVYQLHDGPIEAVIAVRDKGVTLTPGIERATTADLVATSPAPGTYDCCLGATGDGSFIRLGSTPAGGIRVDLKGDKRDGVYRSSVADIAAELALTYGAIDAADLVADDVAALNAKNAAAVGLWVAGDLSLTEALDRLCRSIGAWWGFDRLGRFRLGRLEAPAGTPVLTLRRFDGREATTASDADLLDLERLSASSDGAVPAWRVTIAFKPNWAPQSADELAGSVDEEARATLAAADSRALAEDASIRAKHRLAQEPVIETLLAARAAAEAEAARQLALLKVRRARYRCRIKIGAAALEAIDLAAPVALRSPRFGLEAGALFVAIGLDYAPAEGFVDLTLWG